MLEPIENVKERLYIVRWKFEHLNPDKCEDRVETYQWNERQEAINRYMDLAKPEKWYASHLRFQVAQPKEIDIESLLNSF